MNVFQKFFFKERKLISLKEFQVMKLTPSKGQDMMIWFRPENRSHAFTVYYHFILPVPGMVFIDKSYIFM